MHHRQGPSTLEPYNVERLPVAMRTGGPKEDYQNMHSGRVPSAGSGTMDASSAAIL